MLLCKALSTVGVKALSSTSKKQGGEGIYRFLLLLKSLAGMSVGVSKCRSCRMTPNSQNNKPCHLSNANLKQRGCAHEVVRAAYCWTLHAEVSRTESILEPLIHSLLCDFEYF